MKIHALIAALALTLGGVAFAQAPAVPVVPKDPTATPKIDQRQITQEKRIQEGVASGSLTPKEAARLEKREAKIEADKVAAKSDGKVTAAERKKLTREQNHASNAIKHEKHDRQGVKPAAK
jgi:hypothetical protein